MMNAMLSRRPFGAAMRTTALILCAALIFAILPCQVSAATAKPVIALTYAPPCGSYESFEGVVFTEDGAPFAPSDYRISLYLQLSAGDSYWVKPTYDTPYANIAEDGSFSIRYATGGSDQDAAILHIMLIPASYTPTSSYAATRGVALDYVKVTRTGSGQVTVFPNREAPDAAVENPKTAGLAANGRRMAVNVGFYTDGSAPGSRLSEEQIVRQLAAVSDFADTVRFYGTAGELEKAYPIAYDMGFTVIGTAWLSGNEEADLAELDALIRHCNSGLVRVACVGSETLLRGDLSSEELIRDICYVRDRLRDDSIPVTTAESLSFLLEQPALRNACDILMPNCYAYWSGETIDGAADSFARSIASLKAKAGGKEIVISETGWPTAGQRVGNADPGEAEAARYFEAIRAWSAASEIPVIWFDAADEPWKVRDEGASGAHWGLLTSEMRLKDSFADTPFFNSIYGTEGFENYRTVAAYASGRFVDVSDEAWYRDNVAAAYEYGLMIGTSDVAFSPGEPISVAQAITLACRIHDIFYGLPDDHPYRQVWYDGYVEYAVTEGIIRRSRFDDYDRPALRKEVAVILAAALPDTAFFPVNAAAIIPDVAADAEYAGTVRMLYQAGVLQGSGGGYFEPERTITRAEVAAIASRIVNRALRIQA